MPGFRRIRTDFVQLANAVMIQSEPQRWPVGEDQAQEACEPDVKMRFGVVYVSHARHPMTLPKRLRTSTTASAG